MSALAVELKQLGRRYGAAYVLQDVNLSISAGKTLVLKGSNGAGKTTLLRVLSTRLRPSRGVARVFGFDLAKEAHSVRERVVYLSVFGGAYGGLTPLENLSLAARLYGRNARTGHLEAHLEQVGLAEVRHKLVRGFSSGMKKRLGIARLLLADAELWLLDEPYAALDEAGKGLIDTLLGNAKMQGTTVLMASHELERSARFADRVLELRGGTLAVLPEAPRSKGSSGEASPGGESYGEVRG
jgi:heme exporter protein A